MPNPKISVIVPVYNVEKYLPRCIDSILAQTFTDFELLLIDDGSSDNSGRICDKYAKEDDRIRVFHRYNQGVSATREFGVQHSKGLYIQFVDSDDWIDLRMFEVMYKMAMTNDADIVGCSFYEVYKKNIVKRNVFYRTQDVFIRDIIKSHWGVVWKILVRKSLYIDNDIHFPKSVNGGEDYVVCVKLFINASNICSLDKSLYYYNRCNDQSLMSSFSLNKVYEQVEATKIVEVYLQHKDLYDKYRNELNLRKFKAKFPLLKRKPLLWAKIFPEANKVYSQLNIGWKMKTLVFIINKISWI